MADPVPFEVPPPTEMPKWACKLTITLVVNAPTKEHAMRFMQDNTSMNLSSMIGNPQITLDVTPASNILVAQAFKDLKNQKGN